MSSLLDRLAAARSHQHQSQPPIPPLPPLQAVLSPPPLLPPPPIPMPPSVHARWLSGDATSESPIEKMLFEAFVKQAVCVALTFKKGPTVGSWAEPTVAIYCDDGLTVHPQYEVLDGKYRLDLAALHAKGKIAVEADGHEWHERTSAQASRDKRRDRVLQADGWTVLRFTGSEVNGNADACVAEVLSLARAHR